MPSYNKRQGRDSEIVMFFYAIFGNRIRAGLSPENARQDAYDAVELRYGIRKGRLLNIISEQKTSRSVKECTFVHNAKVLISDLHTANKEMGLTIERNRNLITLLEETINGTD